MVAMIVLSMVVVAILALVAIAAASRSRVQAAHTGRQSDGGAGWPANFSDGGSSDCGAGDAGCDGGGGG